MYTILHLLTFFLHFILTMPKPIATAGGGLSDNNEWERGGNLLCKQEFLL